MSRCLPTKLANTFCQKIVYHLVIIIYKIYILYYIELGICGTQEYIDRISPFEHRSSMCKTYKIKRETEGLSITMTLFTAKLESAVSCKSTLSRGKKWFSIRVFYYSFSWCFRGNIGSPTALREEWVPLFLSSFFSRFCSCHYPLLSGGY